MNSAFRTSTITSELKFKSDPLCLSLDVFRVLARWFDANLIGCISIMMHPRLQLTNFGSLVPV